MAGCYTGTTTVGELKKHGDFGLGTLDALDGEMIALDHAFYQIKSDGKVYPLKDDASSPFATLIFFKATGEFPLAQEVDRESLIRFLDEKLSSENLLYAIKIEGKFEMLKVRSATRQEKPFPVLTDAIKEQKVFEIKDREGTLVGFRVPPYMKGVNVPGYHFHFLSKDRTAGGHVLDFRIVTVRVQIDESRKLSMELPANAEFLKFRFDADPEKAIAQVEK